MNPKQIFKKLKNQPFLRILAALGAAAIVFFLVSEIFEENSLSGSSSVSLEKKIAIEEIAVDDLTVSQGVGPQNIASRPTKPSFLPRRTVSLFKPILYFALFLIIYLLFFQKREPGIGEGSPILYFSLLLVLLIFVFSSADLLRLVLDYYLQKTSFTRGSYFFEKFARDLAKRMAALLLSLPLFSFLNFQLCRKGKEVKNFFLSLFSLTTVFSLILLYFLLYGLFLLGLGVKGIALVDYTFPLAYFSILFPLTLFYLVQYKKR